LAFGKWKTNPNVEGMPTEENQDTFVVTNQQTEVQTIRIPKEKIEGVTADVELLVGDTYGKFTITKIIDRKQGLGPDVVEFSGEDTLEGSLAYSAFGAIIFKVEEDDAIKIPQIYHSAYGKPLFIDFLMVNEPADFTREDFIFDENGNSNSRAAKVRIKNLTMLLPPIDAFGSFDTAEVEFIDQQIDYRIGLLIIINSGAKGSAECLYQSIISVSR
jgi:hypothetical protein